MSKVVTPYPRPLDRSRVHYGEPLLADLIANPSGCSAWVYGMTSGAAYVDTEETTPNPAPRNPHGRLGHDHSGGIYGSPLFRSIATYWLERGDRVSTYWTGRTNNEEAFYYASGSLGAGETKQWVTRPFLIWPPNCDRGIWGAYNQLAVALYVGVVSTSLTGGGNDDAVTFRLRNLAPQFEERSVEFELTDPTSVGNELFESDSTQRLPVVPGVPNMFTIETDLEIHNSNGARGATINLIALELGVYQTW